VPFKVDKPADLMGIHKELLAKVLTPDEELRYLFYSPICESDVKPFGIDAKPGSHAMAVTRHRFVISEDLHTKGIAPTIKIIPFSQVLLVEFGNDLLLGWIAIRFIEGKAVSCLSFFYSSTGIHHVSSAIREYRRITSNRILSQPSEDDMLWPHIWHHASRHQVELLRSIVIEGERPLSAFRSTEIWGMDGKRRKKTCLATHGILIATNTGFISARDESPIRPGMLSFGMNVCCIPRESVRSITQIEKYTENDRLHFIQLELHRKGAGFRYHIPFDQILSASVKSFSRYLEQHRRTVEEGAAIGSNRIEDK